ncbi:hypothetical protein LguiB_032412 [Lonicera macranthoides]
MLVIHKANPGAGLAGRPPRESALKEEHILGQINGRSFQQAFSNSVHSRIWRDVTRHLEQQHIQKSGAKHVLHQFQVLTVWSKHNIKSSGYAFNDVGGGSAAMAELVVVSHASCTYSNMTVGEGAPQLVGRALAFKLFCMHVNILKASMELMQFTKCSAWVIGQGFGIA